MMRLVIALLVITYGLASQDENTRVRSISWHQNSNVTVLPRTQSIESSYSPLQRRTPGRSKGKKGASSSKQAALLSNPDRLQSGNPQKQSSSNPSKANIDLSNKPSSSKVGRPAKSEGKSSERGRSRERPEDTKPSAPPWALANISPDRKRTPSPLFKWSEPDIRGDGSRDNQGGARTPKSTSPSPARSQSSTKSPSPPARLKLPDRSQSSVGSSSRPARIPPPPARSIPLLGAPPPLDAPLSEKLRYLAGLTSPRARFRSPTRSQSSHDSIPSSQRSQSPPGFIISSSKSPDNFPHLGEDEKFERWVGAMQAFTDGLKLTGPTGRTANPDHIRAVEEAREETRQKKEKADGSRAVAMAFSDNARATNPTTVEAMKVSSRNSDIAAKAIKAQTATQTAATFALRDTQRHQDAIRYWKSSARQWMRSQTRDAHRQAFDTEHDARVFRQLAMEKPADDPARGPAFMNAAEYKKMAVADAQTYYRRFKQYQIAKEVFSDASSSSDEEWPLRDTPRSPS